MSRRQFSGQLRSEACLRFGAIKPVSVELGQLSKNLRMHIDHSFDAGYRSALATSGKDT
jgi:hypothetical protein